MRRATLNDLEQLAHLFRDTILTINLRDYTVEQTTAWAARHANTPGWIDKLIHQHFLVEEDGEEITGFASLTNTGHIDMLYVHKDHQRKGIAGKLLRQLERVAQARDLKHLTTEASKTARPVFEHLGFNVVAEQTVMVDGTALNNFKMEKYLI